MPMKGTGSGDLTVVDRFDGGVGWIAHPEETMQRASHAIESEGDLWIIDPVEAPGVDEFLAEYADPAGVVVLLDRHTRDSAALARRHDCPVYIPGWMNGVADDMDAPVERFSDSLAGFQLDRLVDNRLWQEAALYDGETLVVPEALGTVGYFRSPGETLGVHPMLRLFPPKQLRRYDPERLLVGHGEGLSADVAPAIDQAVGYARRTAVPMYLKNVGEFLGIK